MYRHNECYIQKLAAVWAPVQNLFESKYTDVGPYM